MVETKPSIIIPEESYKKLMHYVRGCDSEISGFFDVEWDKEEGAFVMGEVYLVEQECTGTETEMDEDAIAKFSYQLIKQGVKQLPRGWWHSHVNMGAFWSGTDEKAHEVFKNETFTVSIVVNKKSEMKGKLCVYDPFEFQIDDIEIEAFEPKDIIPASILKEIKKKVKVKTYKQPTVSTGYGYGYGYQSSLDDGIPNYTGHGFHKVGQIYKPKAHNLTLPKDKTEALAKIDALDLIRMWNDGIKAYDYKDVATGDVWRDIWNCITDKDYLEVKGWTQKELEKIEKENAEIITGKPAKDQSDD